MSSICIAALDARLRRSKGLTLEVSGRCHSGCQITVARRSGPLDRIVRRQARDHREMLLRRTTPPQKSPRRPAYDAKHG